MGGGGGFLLIYFAKERKILQKYGGRGTQETTLGLSCSGIFEELAVSSLVTAGISS